MLLLESDAVSITVLIDNSLDQFLLEKTPVVSRPVLSWDKSPVAEHGLSLMIEVKGGGNSHTLLLDAGLSSLALLHNIDALQIPLDKIEAIILSHGHMDHIGGLIGLLKKLGRPIDIISHPGAYCQRRLNFPEIGPQKALPALDGIALKQAGANIITTKDPSLWCSEMLLTLGQVPRVTDYEKGFPSAEIYQHETWNADPFIDDQAVVFNVKDKGLVVVSGCAHSGIVNTIRYAQNVASVKKIYAVIGGFHLTGPAFEPIIEQTISDVRGLSPEYVVPMHCTGWKSTHAFAAAMPQQFIMSSVGTKFTFA